MEVKMNENLGIQADYVDATRMPNGLLATGCKPRDDKPGQFFSFFADHNDIIPRGEWDGLVENDVSVEELVEKIKNQRNEGTCASNATGQCGEIITNLTYGEQFWIELSPIAVYRWIAGGPNTGSTISGNLRQYRDVGFLPVDTPRNRQILELAGLNPNHVLKETGYYQQFPSGWKETARHFQADEWMEISNFEGMATASLLDFPICYGRSGHAICGVKLVKRNGQWHIKYANSWGNWGSSGGKFSYGFGYDSESFISRAIRSYGAWALRSIKMSDEIMQACMELAA
jgi:hypothetical protein